MSLLPKTSLKPVDLLVDGHELRPSGVVLGLGHSAPFDDEFLLSEAVVDEELRLSLSLLQRCLVEQSAL